MAVEVDSQREGAEDVPDARAGEGARSSTRLAAARVLPADPPVSATSSTHRRALWPHPYGELFEDASRKPAAIVNVLWREIGREPDALDYLERITGALASVESPFIAAMRGAGIDADGRIVLAYERVEGEGLGTVISRGALPVERAVAVLRQLCRGLATAHAAGINHRALGPASIVIERGGAHPDAVKILDFGLAGVLGETDPKYSPLVPMTPERLLGFGTHTSEDVYLVGCIGYWMLAGVPPFTGEDSDALRRRHAIEDVAPLRTVAKHVPPALAHAIEEALVKDPDDRTADLAAFERALVGAQRDAGIVTPWDSEIAAQSERAITTGESPATSGVFQTVSGRGGRRSPSGSHRPVAAAANSPGRSVVAVGPAARAAMSVGAAAVPRTAPSGSKMPRPHGAAPIHTKVVRPIAEAPTKPVAPAPVVAKPVVAKPIVAKPIVAKPVEAKPVEAKPVATKPAEAKPVVAKPVEAKPVVAKPIEAKPVEAKPVEAKPVEAKPIEAKPVEAKPVEATPVEATPAEATPVEATPVEAKPVEAKPVEAKPVEAKPVEAKPAPKIPNPGRIPPPPRVAARPAATLRIPMPEPTSAPAKDPPTPHAAPPSAATSAVGLSLEDVDALAAGLNLPPPPAPSSTAALAPAAIVAPTQILLKGPILVAPPTSNDETAPTDAATSAARAMPPRPEALPTAITDRTDAETLVETSLLEDAPARRPAWLVPAIAAVGIVTVLAFAFGGGDPTPSPAAPSAPAEIASSSVPTASPSISKPMPVAATPPSTTPAPSEPTTAPSPPATPEIAVAAPPPAEAPPIPTPTSARPAPAAPKPAATVDPVRQQLIRAKDARRKGKRDEAIAAYQSAIRFEPGNRTALRELSRLYFDSGNYESAVRYGKQLVGAAGTAADRVALGDAYFKLGRTADAKAQYQKAAASGDATATKRLAKIGG